MPISRHLQGKVLDLCVSARTHTILYKIGEIGLKSKAFRPHACIDDRLERAKEMINLQYLVALLAEELKLVTSTTSLLGPVAIGLRAYIPREVGKEGQLRGSSQACTVASPAERQPWTD